MANLLPQSTQRGAQRPLTSSRSGNLLKNNNLNSGGIDTRNYFSDDPSTPINIEIKQANVPYYLQEKKKKKSMNVETEFSLQQKIEKM